MKRLFLISSLVAVVAVGFVVARRPAAAHHSSTPFYDDTKRVEAVGTVSRFVFRNPHSFLFIDGQNQAGQTVEWEIELGAAVSMRRSGWTPETIKAGDPIKAVGQPSRAPDTYGMCCAQLTRPDGSPIRP
ncbi:MAG: DUF6152 family protein [Acidobacteriota bacterium]|nr:DUF6152 family protein [Acidobacteriota bacterium]